MARDLWPLASAAVAVAAEGGLLLLGSSPSMRRSSGQMTAAINAGVIHLVVAVFAF